MNPITRRGLLIGSGALVLGGTGTATYAMMGEPFMAPRITRYALTPPNWPEGLRLKLAVVADIHACEPWMSAERISGIAQSVNAMEADLILLLGDYNAGHKFVTAPVMPKQWADALSVLRAPLGVYSILGNHDWWHGPVPGMPGGAAEVRRALEEVGIQVMENRAVALEQAGRRFWLAGLADQMAHNNGLRQMRGADDLGGTLKQCTTDAPILMMAHEPYVFRRMPDRVSLTLCGHTHGGQIYLPGIGAPWSPSRRYRYGHIIEDGRNVIVSGGLGESGVPMRLGSPPELLEIELGHSPIQTIGLRDRFG